MRIAALGAGRMGRGIGHVFAYAGYEVDIIDFKPRPDPRRIADEAIARSGKPAAARRLRPGGRRGAHRAPHPVVDHAGAGEALARADVLFEGVTETVEAKRDAFSRACAHLRADAIIASTTSSMLADKLAAMVTHPVASSTRISSIRVSDSAGRGEPAKLTAGIDVQTVKSCWSRRKVVVRCSHRPASSCRGCRPRR
jgi:3-hydroxyacyl-CoA dehydrogenase